MKCKFCKQGMESTVGYLIMSFPLHLLLINKQYNGNSNQQKKPQLGVETHPLINAGVTTPTLTEEARQQLAQYRPSMAKATRKGQIKINATLNIWGQQTESLRRENYFMIFQFSVLINFPVDRCPMKLQHR